MQDVRTAFFIAYKSIVRGSKSMLVLMIFILSLSFFNMMFISGILNGLENLMTRTLVGILSANIAISPQEVPQMKQFIPNQGELRAQIETIPGVIATARHYVFSGSLSFDRDKNGAFKSVAGSIIGIDPSEDRKVFTIGDLMLAGQQLSDTDRDQIVLSSALAGGFGDPAPGGDLGGATVGDKVLIAYQNGTIRTYTVKCIYNDTIGLFQVFITANEAQTILSTYDNASQIFVKTDLTRNTLANYQSRITAMVPNLKVQNSNDLLGGFSSFLDALSLISYIVSAISVLVAAITIFVMIYINAITKRRQIGILRAIGIRQRIIIYSYVFQSLFYALSGIAIGSLIVFGALVPLMTAFPIYVVFGELYPVFADGTVAVGITSLIVAGLLAGYIPSRIVARMEILKAIWG